MSSSNDPGSRRLKVVQQSKVCKTLPTGTDVEKALKESSRHLRKKKEKSIRSTVDRCGKKQATCEGSYDMSRSSAEIVCAFMLLCLHVPDDGSSSDDSVKGLASSEDPWILKVTL